MSERVAVYDLWKTCSFSLFECEAFTKTEDVPLYKLLVQPGDHVNKLPYIMGDGHFILDDIIRRDERGGFVMDCSNVQTLGALLLSLEGKNSKKHNQALEDWFSASRRFVRDELIDSSSKLVITVPDRLPADGQDRLLNAFRRGVGKGGTLLWRSVAAYLGVREQLERFNLRAGDKVAVIDSESTGVTVSYLWVDRTPEGRLVPAHRLYWDSDRDNCRFVKNYPFRAVLASEDFTPSLPYRLSDGMLVPSSGCDKQPRGYDWSGLDCKLAISIGKNNIPFSWRREKMLITDESGEALNKGAAYFADCLNKGIIAYYDECESLGLVVQPEDEERYEYKVLIAGSTRATADRITGGEISGIMLPAGTREKKFYLRLGELGRDKRLRILSQPIEIPEELEEIFHGRPIELVLRPSLMPGQGRARVEITTKDIEFRKIMPELTLDWENMEWAYNNDGDPLTVDYLEEHMERSYPVDMPYTRRRDSYDYYAEREIRRFVWGSADDLNLNHPEWPNKYSSKPAERFVKVNIFGVPDGDSDGLPYQMDEQICAELFKKLNELYKDPDADKKRIVKIAAWTYHYEELPDIMDGMRKEAGRLTSLSAEYASFYANMFRSKDDAALFLSAFQKKMSGYTAGGGVTKANEWYRAAYQVLMSNSEVMETFKDDDDFVYSIIEALISSYFANKNSYVITSNISRTLCFYLKTRRYRKGFCSKSEKPGSTLDDYYYMLLQIQSGKGTDEDIFGFIQRYHQISKVAYTDRNMFIIWHLYIARCPVAKIDAFLKRLGCRDISVKSYAEIKDEMDRDANLKSSFSAIGREIRIVDKVMPNGRLVDPWREYLNMYLNGKGNMDLPVAILEG